MLRKTLLPTILTILAYGFWVNPDFKEIAAGVAIFLFGMLSLEQGFRSFTGGVLEKILRYSTDKLWKSITFGVVSTTIMQSSSLVSVITISFLSAGLIGLAAGVGIIFGANLGTTTGAWLVAGFGLKVKISAYAMPMLVFGVILIFQNSKPLKGLGYILGGLGFLFLGIHHMKEGFEAFKSTIDLTQFSVGGYPGLFIFAAIGMFATVVMQSSHATLVLIITALAAQQISYENALALAIGANIGTTITAIIGAMSANEQGRRLAGAHLIFNLVTGLIAIVFIQQFILAVNWVSVATGIGAEDYTLKLAVFHTLFNLVGVVVMIPFLNLLVDFLEGFIVAKQIDKVDPKFLNAASVDFPDTAVEAVRNETLHVYDNTCELILNGISLYQGDIGSGQSLEEVVEERNRVLDIDIDVEYENNIKGLYSAIISFISQTSFSWEEEQSGTLHWLRAANQKLVAALKDVKHLRKNMIQHLASPNPHIRQEYNLIRIQIATVPQCFGS
jgi:phosphate:Na+ symporter|tara:strand:- start:2431 stop:3933 length:1503 start_codon:yes stop_codon:yes gene_type:complete